MCRGRLAESLDLLREVIDEAAAAHAVMVRVYALNQQASTLAYLGDVAGARAAADTARKRMGYVRLKIFVTDHEARMATLRDALSESDFDAVWAEGAGLSTEEAISYAQRGRGERKQPSSGWASLAPTELDVVRLVSEGLGNKDIGARLFMSPRTAQTPRVRLAQEAARHG